jgi:hypothetical protein
LRPFASGLQGNARDYRIAIQVLHGREPQVSLAQWLVDLDPNCYETVVVIAPVGGLPEMWPEPLRVIHTTSDELASSDACLCCAMSNEVSDALRQLFFAVLRKQQSAVGLIVLATAAISTEPLALALKHAPFLGQRYRLAVEDPV